MAFRPPSHRPRSWNQRKQVETAARSEGGIGHSAARFRQDPARRQLKRIAIKVAVGLLMFVVLQAGIQIALRPVMNPPPAAQHAP